MDSHFRGNNDTYGLTVPAAARRRQKRAMYGTGRCRESAASSPIREAYPGFAGVASSSVAAGCPIRRSSRKDKAAAIADGRFGRGAQTRLNAPRLLSLPLSRNFGDCESGARLRRPDFNGRLFSPRRRRACPGLPGCEPPCLRGCAGSTAWRRGPCRAA